MSIEDIEKVVKQLHHFNIDAYNTRYKENNYPLSTYRFEQLEHNMATFRYALAALSYNIDDQSTLTLLNHILVDVDELIIEQVDPGDVVLLMNEELLANLAHTIKFHEDAHVREHYKSLFFDELVAFLLPAFKIIYPEIEVSNQRQYNKLSSKKAYYTMKELLKAVKEMGNQFLEKRIAYATELLRLGAVSTLLDNVNYSPYN